MTHASLPLRRAALALAVLLSLSLLTSCRTTGGRDWWNPLTWRQESFSPIHPDDIYIPDLPGVAPLPPPGVATDLRGDDTPDFVSIPHASPIRVEPRELVSEIETIHFPYDSYSLSPEMLRRLERNAEWMRSHAGITIQIEGHCDERGSIEYNVNLGQKRADVVREQLARMGVDPGFLKTISWGEERPAPGGDGHDEAAWAKNRRAQFLIY